MAAATNSKDDQVTIIILRVKIITVIVCENMADSLGMNIPCCLFHPTCAVRRFPFLSEVE